LAAASLIIKSDDFEGKAVDIVDIVDIVDGDEVGWGHHQPLPIDENPITTQIINDAAAKDHKPAKTEVKMETGGPCLEDKGDNVASGDNTGWFYDVPFQHFGEQDTTILELDNSNDLSQYFTNSDDFLILELDDIIDCGGKVAPEVAPEVAPGATTPECTSETTSKTTVEVLFMQRSLLKQKNAVLALHYYVSGDFQNLAQDTSWCYF
jgi:hypothetical protein